VVKAKENGYVNDEDIVVITAGIPLGKSGTTNMLKVAKINNNND
jgi:pyruvate kinase